MNQAQFREELARVGSKNVFIGEMFKNFYLNNTDLTYVVFIDCEFHDCQMIGVDARRALFSRCEFCHCKITDCRFERATVVDCQFNWSAITNMDARGAILTGTDFPFTKIVNISTDFSTHGYEMVCPGSGAFEAWKKCCDKTGKHSRIVHLLIPADAKRSSGGERKCRASKAIVLGIESENGNPCRVAYSFYYRGFKYSVGDTVTARYFDENRWNTCAPGIHFFMTRHEAETYTL